MKLVKIYANKPFKNTRFNPHLNVIMGEPKEKKDNKKDTHNLGKTLLIDVIDFLMLKGFNDDFFLKKLQEKFSDYVFYMEIYLNSGNFLVIRRSVEKPTKISFKLNTSKLPNFEENLEWDIENLSFDKSKEFLNQKLALDVADNWLYRKSITYSLRKQRDFDNVYQLTKFKGPHRDWKPFLFDLLGFDGSRLLSKYEIEEKRTKLENLIKEVKEQFSLGGEESDKLRGIIDLKTEEQKDIEKKIDDFNFYLQDKKINQQLVDTIDAQTARLNSLRYNMSEEINRLQESLRTDVPSVDVEELKQLYEEVEIFFPDQLVKGYKDLESFNRRVSKERKKYMAERLEELKTELGPVEAELKDLEQRRSELLSVLKDKDSYQKFKHYQKALAKVEAEIARMQEKLINLDKLGELEVEIEKLNGEIKAVVEDIRELIKRRNSFYNEIGRYFNHIIQSVLNVPAIISISQNKEGNIVFHADIQDPENMERTAEGYGTTYKKFLCMAFDLSVLMTYSQRSFFRFVYHDGALEGLDNRKKVNFLNAVREICDKYNLQYILTVIDSDIPRDHNDRPLYFSDDEIVLTLHDKDESGLLFEMGF